MILEPHYEVALQDLSPYGCCILSTKSSTILTNCTSLQALSVHLSLVMSIHIVVRCSGEEKEMLVTPKICVSGSILSCY